MSIAVNSVDHSTPSISYTAVVTEPTTNDDGSPLTDLASIDLKVYIGGTLVRTTNQPATSLTGGGIITLNDSMGVSPSDTLIELGAVAIDVNGRKSLESSPLASDTFVIDTTAPSAPTV